MTSIQPRQRQAIVVGHTSDSLLQQVVAGLTEAHWAIAQGDHVYTVAGLLGQINADLCLVIGRPEALVPHNAELLSLLVTRGMIACGLMSTEERYARACAAKVQTYGIPVFMHWEAFRAWLILHVNGQGMTTGRAAFSTAQTRVTEMELAALLDQNGMNAEELNAID